jgi:hypothetical protein
MNMYVRKLDEWIKCQFFSFFTSFSLFKQRLAFKVSSAAFKLSFLFTCLANPSHVSNHQLINFKFNNESFFDLYNESIGSLRY